MMTPSFSSIHPVFLVVLGMALQGCGSSGSGSSGNTVTPFSDPIDSTTLSTALSTGESGIQTDIFWECALSDGNTLLGYQLYTDGTGVETDLNNPNVQFDFTWEATSATTMVTTVLATGMQNTLTDIEFTDQDSMRLTTSNTLTSNTLSLACKRNGAVIQNSQPDVTPASNTLSYGGVVYPLTHGFEEAFSFRPVQRNDTHRAYEFQVADTDFKLLQLITGGGNPLIIWRPNFATVWLRADLYSPGGDGFQSATFEYVSDEIDEKGPAVAEKYFFNEARFGVDIDGIDGIESDANEFIDVTAGTISVTRLGDAQALMNFDFTLADGTTLTGSFSGSFPLYEYF